MLFCIPDHKFDLVAQAVVPGYFLGMLVGVC
jgi:hypothetical protein